jgi:hypothetical protein
VRGGAGARMGPGRQGEPGGDQREHGDAQDDGPVWAGTGGHGRNGAEGNQRYPNET